MSRIIVVLGDGETWMEVPGSKIMKISEEAFQELRQSDYKPKWFGDEEYPDDPIEVIEISDIIEELL